MANPDSNRPINTSPLSGRKEAILAAFPDFRRNYFLGITNGVLFNTGLSFFGRATVVPVFLDILGAPPIVIALASLFEVLGWHLPQLFASKFIVHKSRKMPLYALACVVRITGLLVATSSAWVAETSKPWALVLFISGYSLFALAGGFAGLVFTEILAKTVPKEKRGSYFGWRSILSGIVGLYIGVNVIAPIFHNHPFPFGYLIIFAIGTALIAGSFWLFTRQREPEGHDMPPKRTLEQQVRAALQIFRNDHRFRRFILFRALMMLWLAGIPFYMLLAREQLGAGEAEIGIFTSWEFAGLIVANILWSYISNRVGNRTLLIVGCSLGVVVSALVVVYAGGWGNLPLWSFGWVFFLSGAVDSGVGNGGINYALEIVPEGERPTYLGLMNTLLSLALIGATLLGGLRNQLGYIGLYAVTGAVALASLIFILRLPEPRRANY